MLSYKWLLVFNKILVILVLLAGDIIPARAVVNPDRSRIILKEKDGEESLLLINNDASPSLVQVWVDRGNPMENINKIHVPIAVLPPVFSLQAGQLKDVRLKLIRKKVASSTEQLYWLNIYQVPPNTQPKEGEEQQVVMPLRIRMKLIIRPVSLGEFTQEEGENIKWKIISEKDCYLEVRNQSQRVISISEIMFNKESYNGVTLLPGELKRVVIGRFNVENKKNHVLWSIINDHGVNLNYSRRI